MPDRDVTEDLALERFARLIRERTESFSDYSLFNREVFNRFPVVLSETYPEAHGILESIPVGDLALLYRWNGTDDSLEPVLFMGHYDVVSATEEEWTYHPFGGEIRDGYLYGRGTQDIKCHLGGYLEAVARLSSRGFVPRRTVYFAFGGDEEVAGQEGAGRIADWFRERGIRFRYVLDEGGIISTDGLTAFTPRPAALVGIAEKGMASFRLVCRGKSGHSSMPPTHTAIGILSQAICRIEKHPFPVKIDASIDRLFRSLARHSRGFIGFILKLYPFTGFLLKAALAGKQSTGALIRTTQAVTMISGGTRENVLPDAAEAVVNFRILPGETVAGVKSRLESLLSGLDVRVEDFEGWPSNDPIPAPEQSSAEFELLADTIREVFPEVIPLPFLMVGATDSKQFQDLTADIFRFTPIFTASEDLERVHGVDERISRENYLGMIEFYEALLKNSCE